MSRADKGEPVWHLAATTGEFEQVFWRTPIFVGAVGIRECSQLSARKTKIGLIFPGLPNDAKSPMHSLTETLEADEQDHFPQAEFAGLMQRVPVRGFPK
jgi:hypothetical protein